MNCLSEQLNELTQKIADLTTRLQAIQSSVQCMASKFSKSVAVNHVMETNIPAYSITPGTDLSSNVFDIIDEMADRDRRKNSIVESTDRNPDTESFKALSNTAFKSDVDLSKVIRLGQKIPNKHRPLF